MLKTFSRSRTQQIFGMSKRKKWLYLSIFFIFIILMGTVYFTLKDASITASTVLTSQSKINQPQQQIQTVVTFDDQPETLSSQCLMDIKQKQNKVKKAENNVIASNEKPDKLQEELDDIIKEYVIKIENTQQNIQDAEDELAISKGRLLQVVDSCN